ncbi:MAG: type II secretion system protein GspD, partial [Phycisphaerales bacterium]
TYQRSDSGSFLETPENRRTLSALERRIPAQFQGHTLGQVAAYVKQTCGVDVEIDWPALATIGVDRESPIHLELSEAPARVVLDRALAKVSNDPSSRAGFTVADGIISIGSSETLNRYTVTQPYGVMDLMLLLDIPNFTDLPNMDLAQVVASSKPGRATETPFNSAKKTQKNERLDRDEKMQRLVAIIQNSVDPDGWRDRGGSSGAIQELNGNLIITTTPANHREITGLLSKLRELKSMQINVESRFLTVNQDFFEQIGFDIDLYFNTNSNQISAARATDPNIRPGDFFDFTNSTPIRRVLDSNNFGGGGSVTPILIPPGTADRSLQNTVPPARFSPIGAGQNSLNLGETLANGFSPFATTSLTAAPALGIAGQFLDDVQVDFLIKATQADRRSTTLTAPRLTLTNGQTSNVTVGTQRSFIADLMPVTGESSVGFDPDPQVLTEGVTLQVEAVVSSDRRYVTINIDTAVSQSQQPFRQVAVTAAVGGQLTSSATTNSFLELPTINTTRVQTTVTVPDEGTVLLGGQRIISEIEVETGVPVLSKLPIINRFFTNRVQAKTEQTLLILVKPTILIQTEEEEKNFPGLTDSVRSGIGG